MNNSLMDAVNLLKEKEWVDLTHAFGPESPHFSAFNAADFKTLFDHDDGFFAQEFTVPGQYGTHIDAPIHFVPGDTRYVHELGLKELVLPLVVIDQSDSAAASNDFTLYPDDILAFEKEHGEIEAGSFVALRTDWSKRWPSQAAFENKDDEGNGHTPGWSVDAVQFLFEQRDIKAIGHETFDTDSAKDFQKNGALIAEYDVLDHDTFQVEVMTNLDQLPAKGAVIFNSVPKVKGASGFPVRSFAILP